MYTCVYVGIGEREREEIFCLCLAMPSGGFDGRATGA